MTQTTIVMPPPTPGQWHLPHLTSAVAESVVWGKTFHSQRMKHDRLVRVCSKGVR